ncbi:RING finger protein 215 isoform X2 [Electrophorus electricus]|uniref:RING finger protein 215 isoform X2 n=1 Tax=Electrophorus electricus TaxID=8005 RepID=UPI0015D0725B|nr:RING finger protein 215 isoform X2 [Electrophorus electricus]
MTAVNCHFSEIFLLLSVSLPCAVHGEQVAFVEVIVREQADASGGVLQGDVLKGSLHNELSHNDNELQADLRLIQNENEGVATASQDPWIGVVHAGASAGSHASQESFTAAVVRKMRRALVLGASALIILVLNQNTVREMDLAEILSKPVVIIQTSENVTKLIGALLRGLHVTAKITYRTFLQNNVGATLTLWSSCGRSRGGLYSEWQGVVCTGETNSPVQKYLQQLWDTVVLAALILSTGVIVQARWQYQDNQFNDELELLPKQDLLQRLSVLRTRTYKQPKAWSDTDSCAVCLEQYSNNQCLRVLPCLHEFHRDCVDPWLLLQQTCPLCKRSVLGNFY